MSTHYDVVAIGAGTAGLTLADIAPRLGLKAALIEKNKLGGDCTWMGCIPSKALLKVARVAHAARTAEHYGLSTGPVQTDMRRVRGYIQSTIDHIATHETPEKLQATGVDVILGAARFTDSHTIEVNGERITADNVLIATGASAIEPPITGLGDVPYYTYETIWANDRLPQHLIIVGAGAIGSEIGQAYRRLGAAVTLIDVDLMPGVDPDARATIRTVFEREGITIQRGLVESVATGQGDAIHVTLQNGESFTGDMLLVAVGRSPNVSGLGLEQAGVAFTPQGITVDKNLKTSVSHIYAAGDCTGAPQFTHYAGFQAFQALRNMLLPLKDAGQLPNVPYVTFTDPEVAHAGLLEAEARAQYGDSVRVSRVTNDEIDRSITDNDLDGFIKVIHKPNGEILGVTMVAERAGDALIEFIMAMEHNIKLDGLPLAIHPYPTYATGIQLLAADFTADKLMGGILGKVVKVILGTSGNDITPA